MDTEGQPVHETSGWHLLHNQHGYALCDTDGNFCFEEVDEVQLALLMRSVPRRAPIMTEQMDSVIEQNQQLRLELEQSLLTHRTDAKRACEAMKQKDVQVQSDFRVMRTEFEKRQVEWAEKAHVDQEKYEVSIHVERKWSNKQCKESDVKWTAFMQPLQDDQAKRQKEAEGEHICLKAEVVKQRVQHEERHAEQQ